MISRYQTSERSEQSNPHARLRRAQDFESVVRESEFCRRADVCERFPDSFLYWMKWVISYDSLSSLTGEKQERRFVIAPETRIQIGGSGQRKFSTSIRSDSSWSYWQESSQRPSGEIPNPGPELGGCWSSPTSTILWSLNLYDRTIHFIPAVKRGRTDQ